jgi:predicted peroxiredoxin
VHETTNQKCEEKARLKNSKHEQGSIEVLLPKLYDVIKECKTMGVTVTYEMKRIYLMMNVNEKIFKQMLVLWHVVLTRKCFRISLTLLRHII